jgi:hypothetical protein
MQVENAIAFAVDQEPAGLELRINFGVFAGRDATSAELEELGKLLVSEAGEISIVGEERHEMSEEAEVVPSGASLGREQRANDRAGRKFCERLVTGGDLGARQCISEHAELSVPPQYASVGRLCDHVVEGAGEFLRCSVTTSGGNLQHG